MAILHVFNPEHDFALAHGKPWYSAPLSVKTLAKTLEALPCIWADNEDLILTADSRIMRASSPLASPEYIEELPANLKECDPWGWDSQVKKRLADAGAREETLPTDKEIEEVRRLSHRRTSILCNRRLDSPIVPREFYDLEEAIKFWQSSPGCYFKLPWSSGGRGVVDTSELTESQIRQWLTGALRRQGSVTGEERFDKTLHFASLWTIKDGKAEFDGYSMSLSDGRGKYSGNLFGQRGEMERIILDHTRKANLRDITDRQKEFLESEIAENYTGKAGIDMMAGSDGSVFPCVEVNLRRTMGHVALDYTDAIKKRPELEHIGKLIPLKHN